MNTGRGPMTVVVLALKVGSDLLAFSQRSLKKSKELYSVSGGKSSEDSDFWAMWQPPDEHSRRSCTPEVVRLVEYQSK